MISCQINGYLEPGTYLELEGTPHGRNSLKVESCTQIPNALAESFDHELYNEIVKAQATRFDENKIRIHDVHEHFGGSSAEDLQLLTKPSAQQGFGDQSFM